MSVLAEKVVHRRRQRFRGSLVIGVVLLGLFLLASAAPGWLAPYDPLAFDMSAILKPPSALHPFGTDNFGRDILSRLIWAAHIDLAIALFTTVFPVVFGTIVGAFVGYYGGWLDMLFGRVVDLVVTFFLVIVITIVSVLGPGLLSMFIAVSVVGWSSTPSSCGRMLGRSRRLCRRRQGAGLWRSADHLPPSPAQRHHADHRLLDDRHGPRHPAGLEPRLSRPRRSAADGGMGRHHRRRQEFHEHGLVDLGLSGHRHRAHGLGFSLLGSIADRLRRGR
jgi:hypothetical protein